MEKYLKEKYDRLKGIVRDAGSVAIAFSGGVDSTFLFKVCVDLLGDRAIGVTARSATFPARELEEAVHLAEKIGGRHMVIDSEELEVPGFSDNPPNRCFLCKRELFSKVTEICRENGIPWIFDGSNADDVKDFRPGREAGRMFGVRRPLEEAGLTKSDIRILSRLLELPTWNKPAMACLSSRFPYYSPITKEGLAQVAKAEQILWDLGMREFRVRHHDTIARIELGDQELDRFMKNGDRDRIVQAFRSLGYLYVTLDLAGYRSGSMNDALAH